LSASDSYKEKRTSITETGASAASHTVFETNEFWNFGVIWEEWSALADDFRTLLQLSA
jgi:hypothetical protein